MSTSSFLYDKFHKILILRGNGCLVAAYSIWTILYWYFLYAGWMSNSFNINNFLLTLVSTNLRLPEDDADALKHIRVLTIYKVLLYIYIYCIFWSGK
jgi:hypothetical protein